MKEILSSLGTNLHFELHKPIIYIAGPMSGLPNNNWEVFFNKEQQLIKAGWHVINPARMDKDAGILPEAMGEYSYEDCARRDIQVLKTCNAIYMLSGWQHSKGACWERALAYSWGISRYYEVPRADKEMLKISSSMPNNPAYK